MRRLYLVPIRHMSADMGSLAPALDDTAKTELGGEVWERHKAAVSGFWDEVSRFLDGTDVRGVKIYQDGMAAGGADGLRIVREGISQGSKNFKIIGQLLERGATLVKTEDPALVTQEYAHIARIARARSPREKEVWALRYGQAKDGLLKQRDDFIAGRIKETLGEGETGVLFIGASHDVRSRLPPDIEVVTVKAPPPFQEAPEGRAANA